MCTYVHIYKCMNPLVFGRIHVLYTHICMFIFVHIRVSVCVHVYIQQLLFREIGVCIRTYVCILSCVGRCTVYMHIWEGRETNTHMYPHVISLLTLHQCTNTKYVHNLTYVNKETYMCVSTRGLENVYCICTYVYVYVCICTFMYALFWCMYISTRCCFERLE